MGNGVVKRSVEICHAINFESTCDKTVQRSCGRGLDGLVMVRYEARVAVVLVLLGRSEGFRKLVLVNYAIKEGCTVSNVVKLRLAAEI